MLLSVPQNQDELDHEDPSIGLCLQDFDDEIKNPSCKEVVKKYKQLAAEDVRFNLPLADACYEDRLTLCGDVPPVRSLVPQPFVPQLTGFTLRGARFRVLYCVASV